jgi:hypothetical protein
VFLAWLVAEGIVCYQTNKATGFYFPPPGRTLAVTGVYAALAVVAQNDDARFLAQAVAWGYVGAAFLNLFGHETDTDESSSSTPPSGKTTPQPTVNGSSGAPGSNPIVNV